MKSEKIAAPAGFTYNVVPDYKPAISVFGVENTGKSRLMCTAPHDDGLLAVLALDKNSKATIEDIILKTGDKRIVVNTDPILSHKDARALAMAEAPAAKEIYKVVFGKLMDLAVKLAADPNVESIGVDNNSIVFDIILFSHFGRRNQIESFQRGAPNQDMIDFIKAMGNKNLVLIHRAGDVWKDTGEKDSKGKAKQAPTGKMKADGLKTIGAEVVANLELISRPKKGAIAQTLADKYSVMVHTCKGNTLLEGQTLDDMGVTGRAITWENIMLALNSTPDEEEGE